MDGKLVTQRRTVWRIGVLSIDKLNDIFNLNLKIPIKIFGEMGVRKGLNFFHTYADPFLYIHNGRLFLFYEAKTDFKPGRIQAKSLDDSGDWIDHGVVIEETFHVSYPQVFTHKGRTFMIPETAASGCVWLYEGVSFPVEWKRQRMLIDKPLKDPSVLINDDGVFILGTTEEDGLSLYFGNNFECEFRCIQVGITRDLRYCRNAGGLFEVGGKVYRPFQDCSHIYGEKLGLALVNSISQFGYIETVICNELIKKKPDWMRMGYHHLSIVTFGDKFYVALDGMRLDCYLNTLVYAVLRLVRLIKDGFSDHR